MITFLRIDDVIGSKKKGVSGIIPMSRSNWYQGISEGRYPAGVKLSERSIAWRSTDIESLVTKLSESRG